MVTLRIQHSVPDFSAWRRAFDADPLDRRGGGVRGYGIHRAVSDPSLVMVDLAFDTIAEADAFLVKLRRLWDGAGQRVMTAPQAWIVETILSEERR